MFKTFDDFLNEEFSKPKFTHKINSEKYWRRILDGNQFALKILDTVMKKQNGMASDRQWEVLKRAEIGDKSPYHTKN
jgi:hypothetical protein